MWSVWLIVLLVFLLVKVVLFFFPTIVHRTRRNPFKSQFLQKNKFTVVAHRGGSYEGLENTISAARECLKHGVYFIEGDALVTRDGQLVMLHDSNLQRLTGEDVDIGSVDADQLPFFQESVKIHFSEDECFTDVRNLEKRPDLLRDFFKEFEDQNVFFSIEIKSGKAEHLRQAVELAEEMGVQDKVAFGVARESLRQIQKEVQGFTSFMDLRNGVCVFLSFFLGKKLGHSTFYMPFCVILYCSVFR